MISVWNVVNRFFRIWRGRDEKGEDAIYREILPTLKLQTHTGPTSISSIVTHEQYRLLNCKRKQGLRSSVRSFVDMNLYVVRLYPVAACSLLALHYAVFIAYFLSLKYRNIVFVWISRKRRCKHYVRSFKHLLFGCVRLCFIKLCSIIVCISK